MFLKNITIVLGHNTKTMPEGKKYPVIPQDMNFSEVLAFNMGKCFRDSFFKTWLCIANIYLQVGYGSTFCT